MEKLFLSAVRSSVVAGAARPVSPWAPTEADEQQYLSLSRMLFVPPSPLSLLDRDLSFPSLSFQDAGLDAAFGGSGVPCGRITEMFGPAGCGKSQLCMLLSCAVQLPFADGGLEGRCLYLHCKSGSSFPAERIQQLCDGLNRQRSVRRQTQAADSANVLVMNILSLEELLSKLPRQIPRILETQRVRLLVIDSIADLCRVVDAEPHEPERRIDERDTNGDSESDDAHADARAAAATTRTMYRVRSDALFRLSSLLRKVADEYSLAVLVTNQVSSRPIAAAPTFLAADSDVPALGLSWSHCIHSRFQITLGPRAGHPLAPAAGAMLDDMEEDGSDGDHDVHGRPTDHGRKVLDQAGEKRRRRAGTRTAPRRRWIRGIFGVSPRTATAATESETALPRACEFVIVPDSIHAVHA